MTTTPTTQQLRFLTLLIGAALVFIWSSLSLTSEPSTANPESSPASAAPEPLPEAKHIERPTYQIDAPPGWSQRPHLDADLMLVERPDKGFQDNLNISLADPIDVDAVMPEICSALKARLQKELASFELRACELDAWGTLRAIRTVFEYVQNGREMSGEQFIIRGGDLSMFATCSIRSAHQENIRRCAASVRSITLRSPLERR